MGLKAVKASGGRALVQNPAEAEFAGMPLNAILNDGHFDFVGRIEAIAFLYDAPGGRPDDRKRPAPGLTRKKPTAGWTCE